VWLEVEQRIKVTVSMPVCTKSNQALRRRPPESKIQSQCNELASQSLRNLFSIVPHRLIDCTLGEVRVVVMKLEAHE
jgi:hypothetical protein